MHILEIPSFFPPHGGLFCLTQAKALKDCGHEVRILSCTQLGYKVDKDFFFTASPKRLWINMEGIEVYQTYMRGLPKFVRYNVWRWIDIVEDMFTDYVKRYGKPDVIHAHCCKLAGVAAMNINRKHAIPYYITEHLSSELYTKDFGKGWHKHQWLKSLMIKAYRDANMVVPVSKELVDNIAPFFGKEYKYKEISNVIDTEFFLFRERTPYNGRPYRYCCLAIANIYEKGYDVLAKAWKNIDNAELHIAGSGTDGKQVRELFAGSGNVTFHGHLDKYKVRQLLYDCDALVLPSRSEAQPLVLLEAMSTGIPVVTTECVPSTVRIAGACLISQTGSADSLTQKMIEIQMISPSESFSMAVRNLASPDVVAKQLEEVFNSNK